MTNIDINPDDGLAGFDELSWAIAKEEYEAALVADPNCSWAISQRLKHQQWCRQQSLHKQGRPVALTLTKKVQQRATAYAGWRQTERGFVICVPKAKVGNVVKIRRDDGSYGRYRLITRLAPNEYEAELVERRDA